MPSSLSATDPICQMLVKKKNAKFTHLQRRDDGEIEQKFYFCSASCLAKFTSKLDDNESEPPSKCCGKGKVEESGDKNALKMQVPGMGSEHCAGRVRLALESVDGVEAVQTNIVERSVQVNVRVKSAPSLSQLRDAVVAAGYAVVANDVAKSKGIDGNKAPADDAPTENGRVRFIVPGMGSTHCAGLVETSLWRVEGVQNVKTNAGSHRVDVVYDVNVTSVASLQGAIERGGYAVAAAQYGTKKGNAVNQTEDIERQYLQRALRNFFIAFVPAALIMILMIVQIATDAMPSRVYLGVIAFLGIPVVFLFGAFSTHVSAFRSLANRTANMDVLISMGSAPPYIIGLGGFFVELTSFIEMATTIMTFHLLGRYLEARAKGRASQAIRKLLSMAAKSAIVERPDGEEVDVAIEDLMVGDIMIIRPGAKVPTDGEVVFGASYIDESMATGESVPVEKFSGDGVIGATINGEGLLKVRATRVGDDTFLSNVVRMIEEAQGSKVPIQEFADRVTGRFVPTVLLLSVVAFVVWAAAYEYLLPVLEWGSSFLPWVDVNLGRWQTATLAAIAVLVISCPCALGLATPTAIMVGAGLGAEHGVLIRSGEAIQTLRKVTVIAFDKTGTITCGKPSLTDVIVYKSANSGTTEEDLLRSVASAEAGSEHPLGQAIVKGAKARGLTLSDAHDFKAIVGRGVEATVDGRRVHVGNRRLLRELEQSAVVSTTKKSKRRKSNRRGDGGSHGNPLDKRMAKLERQGKTCMLVAFDGLIVGLVAVADTVKEDSARAIAQLRARGVRTVMITGDNERVARYIAKQVGIDDFRAGVLPDGKVNIVSGLQNGETTCVAMVGDGINDAPALKQANVGIAIGAGADVAIDVADVVLVGGDLSSVNSAIVLSRKTFRKIMQNLFWASFYNVAAIPLALLGLLHPMVGVAAMTISSLSVIGNSILLRRVKLN